MKDNSINREILEEPVATIQALGEKSKVAMIPREYILPWLTILTTCTIVYRLLRLFFELGDFWLILSIFWLCAAWSLIAGRKSHNFTDEFYPLPSDNWIDVPKTFVPATDELFLKLSAQKFRFVEEKSLTGDAHKYHPFQQESELHGNMRVTIAGQSFVSFFLFY